MTDDIIVVRECHALDEAEAMARRRYNDIPVIALENDHFEVRTDGVEWANHIAPTLRCLAGYRDAGKGTWNINGDIALIPDGDEADRPSDAIVMSASHFVSDVHQAYRDQAYDCYRRQRQKHLESQED